MKEVASELGCTPAKVALAGTLNAPGVTAPIIGARTIAHLEDNLAISVKGAFSIVQKLAPLLSADAGIVLTTSIANVIGMVDTSIHAAGKAALRSMAPLLLPRAAPAGNTRQRDQPGSHRLGDPGNDELVQRGRPRVQRWLENGSALA